MHTFLANFEPAAALPAKNEFPAATVALLDCFSAFSAFSNGMGLIGHWEMGSSIIAFAFLFGQLRLRMGPTYGVLSFMLIHGTTGPLATFI
jgi:hypothetical protein